jgi:DNA-binding NarL/FixJ family response regulator
MLRSTAAVLIVLDLFLSRKDFAESIETLQQLAGQFTPILIVAAWMPSDVAAMAMRAGCSLMSKPPDPGTVVRAIRQLLSESATS